MINQGDLFWIDLGDPRGSEPGYRHPYVVVQNNVFNRSRIGTVIVCALTSKQHLATVGGNVPLRPREGNLPKRSAVNVSQVFTVDKSQLVERIGTLAPSRVRQIVDGLVGVVEPREIDVQD